MTNHVADNTIWKDRYLRELTREQLYEVIEYLVIGLSERAEQYNKDLRMLLGQ